MIIKYAFELHMNSLAIFKVPIFFFFWVYFTFFSSDHDVQSSKLSILLNWKKEVKKEELEICRQVN
jgi:hypothetical protein